VTSPNPIPLLLVPPPPGAKTLVVAADNKPVVWESRRPSGDTIIYSALPLNQIAASMDPAGVCDAIWRQVLVDRLEHSPRLLVSPPNAAAGLYRTKDGLPLIALMNPDEAKATAPPHYDRPEELTAVVATIPPMTATVTMHDLPADVEYNVRDVIARACTDANGTLTVTIPLHLAKMIALVPLDRDRDAAVARFEPYLEPWQSIKP
jgi:hypothetical protein